MERQARPRTTNALQLVVASEALREVLREAVQQPEGVKEQVAEVVKDLLASLRLQHLPTDLLASIARSAGRPSRLLSTALNAAYGPLTCGLALDPSTDQAALAAMLARSPSRFHFISSLVLASSTVGTAFLESLPRAFPRLASLQILADHDEGRLLDLLAPLAAGLTSLTVRLDNDAPAQASEDDDEWLPASQPDYLISLLDATCTPPEHAQPAAWAGPEQANPQQAAAAVHGLARFTSLRTLALHAALAHDNEPGEEAHYTPVLPDLGLLAQLSSLRQLQHLELDDWGTYQYIPAAPWFPSLARLPLTALELTPCIFDWDRASIDALATLTLLRSLRLHPDFTDMHGDSIGDAALPQAPLAAALVRLPLLTALTLRVDCMEDEPASGDFFSAMTGLRSLSLGATFDDSTLLTGMLVALCAAKPPALTHLRIAPVGDRRCPLLSDRAAIGLQLYMGACLQRLDIAVLTVSPYNLCYSLSGLTSLAELSVRIPVDEGLEEEDWWDPDEDTHSNPRFEQDWPSAVAELAGLTRLRALRIVDADGHCERFPKAVLQMVTCFAQLQELSVQGDGLPDAAASAGDVGVTGEDLWHLLPLKGSLTSLRLSHLWHVDRRGLAVVGELTCLQSLQLDAMSVLGADVAHCLLPLPPSLRRIDLGAGGLGCGGQAQVRSTLQAAPAGGLPSCTVRFF